MQSVSLFVAIALRQARRDRQLVSKRLLLNEDEDISMETIPADQVRVKQKICC